MLVEDVTAPRYCPDKTLRLGAEDNPNVFQALAKRVVRNHDIRPHSLDQFMLVDHPARILDQISKQGQRFRAQRDVAGSIPQPALLEIQRVTCELEN
ncbi:hypothetical protein WHT83_19540 [Aminobacter sp. P9b]